MRTTGTKAERDGIRLTLGSLGASPAIIAAELQRRFGLRPREAFRQAQGWTQDQVAARLNAAGTGAATYTGARVSDYERWPFGGRRPSITVLRSLGRIYETDVSRLVDLDDLESMPESETRALVQSPEAHPPPAKLVHVERPGNIIGQHPALDLSTTMHSEMDLVMAVTERTQEFGSWSESSNVGPLTLADIAANTKRIAQDYLTDPPAVVYARAAQQADRVFRLLQTGRQHLDQTKELYRWAGYLCTLLAWMAGDLGQQAAAETQARTAWACTEPAADATLRAWVLSTMSKIYLWDQRFEDAADAAARGFAIAPKGTAAIMLACQEADAWAEIGAGDRATTALERVEEAHQQNERDEVGGLLHCGDLRKHNYTGSVLLRIGKPLDAIQRADAALQSAKADSFPAYGTLAQVRIWAATAHLQVAAKSEPGSPGIDGAAELLSPVLSIPVEKRLDTVVRRLREVSRFISSTPALDASRPGQQLRSDIIDFCTTGSIRQISA
jgi:transcriptional regulator with XRE-family HTH domain/tetratricopeptide (TPR) repeat protein